MIRFIRLSLLLALLVLGLVAPGGASAVSSAESVAPRADAAGRCAVGDTRGYGTSFVLRISAARITCARARELVRAFHACRPGKTGRCPRVSGYRCSEERFNRTSLSYEARVRCTRGAKVVRHVYLQFL